MIFDNININYNNQVIYDNYKIEIEDNSITAIIGPSGIGKTTLLEYISKEAMKLGFKVSYVFQEYRLIPWKTVKGNLQFIFDEDCIMSINEALKIVGLDADSHKYPSELSGGMKQRLNIARVIIKPGNFIILDEAFKSIDINTKNRILTYLKEYIASNHITCVFVTHDIEEAKFMANNIIEIDKE